MAIEKVVASLYSDGSGFIVQTLLGDLLIVALVGIVSNFLVLPTVRHYNNYKRILKNVPSPKPHWFLGDLKTYTFTAKGMEKSVDRCTEYPAMSLVRYGWLMWTVHVYHPDVIKELINKQFPKGKIYRKTLIPLLRNGLVTSSGPHWKRHRRMLNPIFNIEILKNHVLVFNKNCNTFLKQLEEPAESNSNYNVTLPIGELGYTDNMECILSRKTIKEGAGKDFAKLTAELSALMMLRTTKVIYLIDAVWAKLSLGKRFFWGVKSMTDLCLQFIVERRSQLQQLSEANETSIKDDFTGEAITIKQRKGKLVDFLDILVQTKDENGVNLTDDEIIDEVTTFFGAGQETTAAAIGWLVHKLACHPDEQQKCRNEIMEIMGDEKDVTWSHISKLRYVTLFIRELLRLHSVVHQIGRELTEDVTFKDPCDKTRDVTFQKGTSVTFNIHALHRNPHIWKNPNDFIPERFLPENSTNRSPYAYIPFSAGHRNCIGQNFAMSKMKVFICKLLKNYELYRDNTTAYPIPLPGIALLAEDGIEIKFRKIN